MEKAKVTINCAGVTHRGLQRDGNEDCMLILDDVCYDNEEKFAVKHLCETDNFLIAVADGVGGAPAGDFASRFVLEELSQKKYSTPEEVSDTIIATHNKLLKNYRHDKSKRGCATTVAGICCSENSDIIVFNVGDARVYRITDSSITKLTEDDNLASLFEKSGLFMVDDEEIIFSNTLTQSIGGVPLEQINPHINVFPRGLFERFLICTDGLYKTVNAKQLFNTITRLKTPDSIVKNLLLQALKKGGPDNITLIYAEVSFPD